MIACINRRLTNLNIAAYYWVTIETLDLRALKFTKANRDSKRDFAINLIAGFHGEDPHLIQ